MEVRWRDTKHRKRRVPSFVSLPLATFFLILGMFFLILATASGEWPFEQPNPSRAYARDHVIVRFKTNEVSRRMGRHRFVDAHSAARQLTLPKGARLVDTPFGRWRRGGRTRRRKSMQMFARQIHLDRHVYSSVPPGMTAEELVEQLSTNPAVEYAELDGIGIGGAVIPNDPTYAQQWWHDNTSYTNGQVPSDIRSQDAWEITHL